MADNLPAYYDTGLVQAADDISSVLYIIQKLAFGALDAATLVSLANGLPVQIANGGAATSAIAGVAPDNALAAIAVAEIQRKTLKRAVINLGASGDNTVIAAVASKVLKVYAYAIQSTGTVTAKLTDGAAGASLSLNWTLQAREGAVSAVATPPNYLFKTTAGLALILNLSGAVTVGCEVSYWDDDAS